MKEIELKIINDYVEIINNPVGITPNEDVLFILKDKLEGKIGYVIDDQDKVKIKDNQFILNGYQIRTMNELKITVVNDDVKAYPLKDLYIHDINVIGKREDVLYTDLVLKHDKDIKDLKNAVIHLLDINSKGGI